MMLNEFIERRKAQKEKAAQRQRERRSLLKQHRLCVICKGDAVTAYHCEPCRLWHNQKRSGYTGRVPHIIGRS